MKIKFPTQAELKPLYDEAIDGQTEEQWMEKFLATVTTMLRKNPLWYRAYGVYWWGVKQMLIERNLIASDFVDAEWVEKIQYEKPAYHLLAAFAYHDERQDIGALEDDTHVIELDDGSIDSYILIDEDFELHAVANTLS
ncbi:hypothetical protein [Vibrio parahaemolyticus]|uniref:hypothetical protein n=1 Tax=Vibrio parahaemolyticus TaxID=670 RepID=UPI00064AD6DD|nr:hypothetical protein [Vibrio parahaemolyticus]EII3127211.1 hypothetical protein [Vibrio parahaemolyticus]